MNNDPDEIRRQQFVEIGALIRTHAASIIDEWEQAARSEHASAQCAHRSALRDHLPLFLEHVGAELSVWGLNREQQRDAAARSHGHDRWQNGWKLDELIQDYQLLRIVLSDYLRTHLARPLSGDEVKAIGLLLDDAIQDAVVAYVGHQEEHLSNLREAAETASRSKSAFVANVSHEIRTPMNAILGMIELALAETLTPEIRDYLHTAHESAKSLLSLVNNLLDYSKMELGQLQLEDTPFDLWEVLDETAKALSIAASRNGLELLSDVSDRVPRYLRGDPFRLRQVLTNLIGNGIKFTKEGEVTLKTSLDNENSDGVTVRFAVSDTGIGIPPDAQERIFAPFTQVDASTTRLYGGSGLGLAICSALIKQFGGQLRVHSEIGRGSEFVFTARFAKGHPVAASSGDEETRAKQLAGKRVLVLDDNATNRTIVSGVLSHLSMQVDVSDSAEATLQRMRAAAAADVGYDIVLIDALMPETDGFTVVKAIQDDPRLAATTVLMVSSADRALFHERLRGLEIDGYLDKPVSRRQLLKVMSDAALGAVSESSQPSSPQQLPAPLSVLVVDDTPANRKVVQAVLRKRGHNVTLANNGRDAIEQLLRRPFDVVLMDVQMAAIDGHQATQAIRAMDDTTRSRVPIIAMTAHAMPGDADKCFQVGMNDYISKPIDFRRLTELVEYWGRSAGLSPGLGGTNQTPPKETQPDPDPGKRPLADFEVALARLDGNRSLLKDLIEYFRQDMPQLLEQLGAGLSSGSGNKVMRAAHSIKGLAASVEAKRVAAIAAAMEQLASTQQLEEVSRSLPVLRLALADFEATCLVLEAEWLKEAP